MTSDAEHARKVRNSVMEAAAQRWLPAAILHTQSLDWCVVHRAERLDRWLWSYDTSDLERRHKVFHEARGVC